MKSVVIDFSNFTLGASVYLIDGDKIVSNYSLGSAGSSDYAHITKEHETNNVFLKGPLAFCRKIKKEMLEKEPNLNIICLGGLDNE